MKTKIIPFIVLLVFMSSSKSWAQSSQNTDNVVLILIDGYRWQELFHGANLKLLTNSKYNSMDSVQRLKQFWAEDLETRREKLMPFTWNYIVKHGQIYGNRTLGSKVNVKNPYWYSYPGRAEVLSGFVDEKINSNDYGINTNPNVLEFLNKQDDYQGKVVTFACWGATGRCLNKPNSDMLINVPWENIEGDNLTDAEVLANEIQHFAPKTFGDVERLDFEVYALAKSYIKAQHPKVIYLDFGDTDEYAHHGEYDHYLLDIQNLDAMIQNLWEMMQKDPFYEGKTTLMIVPDHGRGLEEQWTSHGAWCPHSDETWMMVMGPDTKPMGEIQNQQQIYENQFAATIAKLLGFTYTARGRTIGAPIKSAL